MNNPTDHPLDPPAPAEKRKPRKPAAEEWTLIVDTREQLPFAFDFASAEGVQVRRDTVDMGDYAAELPGGIRVPVRVERKSPGDLFGSVTAGRERFEAEFGKARAAGLTMHVVIEASWADLDRAPTHAGKANPHAVKMTLLSWALRMGVGIWPAGSRLQAERLTFHLLRFAVRHHLAGRLVLPHVLPETA